MKKDHDETIKAREGAFGSLAWYLNVPESQKGGEVLLGRMIALYDHVTEGLSMLQIYSDPESRGVALAKIGNWTESQSKRVRQAYSRICLDCKGMGRNEILSDDFDCDLFEQWYSWQKDALDGNDILRKVLHRIWGGDVNEMITALSIPGKVFQNWNTWLRPMGPDSVTCLKAAFIPMIATGDGYRLYANGDWDSRDMPEKWEATKSIRETFAHDWESKENELLALPPERRSELWEN